MTFDSNLWEQIVHPHTFTRPAERHAHLVAVHGALRDRRISGFISQSVATLEGLKRRDRPKFLTTQIMRARVLDTDDPDFKPVVFAPDQSGRPKLMPILVDRIRDAVQLGMRIIEIPIYTELKLPSEFFADQPHDFIDQFGPAQYAITQRGLGRAVLEELEDHEEVCGIHAATA